MSHHTFGGVGVIEIKHLYKGGGESKKLVGKLIHQSSVSVTISGLDLRFHYIFLPIEGSKHIPIQG